MKVLFFGSSEFSIPFIEALLNKNHRIELVFTGRDKGKGRSKVISPNHVKSFAMDKKLQVFEIEVFDDIFYRRVIDSKFDFIVSVSYGKILPERFIDIAGGRTVNVHPSILPRYRGPSPVISSLLNGDTMTGVTLIRIEKKIDSGDIYLHTKVAISEEENKDTLEKKLTIIGTGMLMSLLDLIKDKNIVTFPQSETGISYTKLFSTGDTLIDWKKSSSQIINKIRAFGNSPGSRTNFKGKIIKVLAARQVQNPYPQEKNKFKAGQVIKADRQGIVVKCGIPGKGPGTGVYDFISLQKLKPQDKNAMDYIDFLNCYRIKPGDSFE